jgi:WD40 repeat protein
MFYLVASAPCSAMENNKQLQEYGHYWLNSIQDIAIVKHPRCVRYITKDQIVINGADGKFYSVHLKTQKIQKSSNKKIITCNGTKITFYSAGERPVLWSCKTKKDDIRRLTWNPFKNTLLIYCGEESKKITLYNYGTNKCKDIFVQDRIDEIMTMHPKKEILCTADCSGNISFYKLDDALLKIQTISSVTKGFPCWWCQYSPDGSYIVVGSNLKLYIIDHRKKGDVFPCVRPQKDEEFKNIAFHPNGSILAILCQNSPVEKPWVSNSPLKISQLIRYLDLKTQKYIGITPEIQSDSSYDLCFSDDGLEVVVVLKDKCVRMHVSFAIKEKGSYCLCVLNRFKACYNLPLDIVQYCRNILLELFKF